MHHDSRTDDELLAAWRRGERGADHVLCHRYLPTLARFFRNKVPRGDDEDLTQKTFLEFIKARDRIHTNVKGYILGIARNVLLKYIESKRPTASLNEDSMAALARGATSVFTRHRRARRLLEALRNLTISQQMLLELFYWEDYTSAELGEYFEAQPSTMRTRLAEARQQLRRLLNEPGNKAASEDDLDEWVRDLRRLVGPDRAPARRPPPETPSPDELAGEPEDLTPLDRG